MKSLRGPVFSHIRAHGLTENQFMVLEILHSKGTLTVNDIIDGAFSTDGNVGVVIKNLMKQGLVQKSVDGDDKRVRRVSLTAEGEAVARAYLPVHERFLDEFLGGVSTEDKKALISLLKKIGKQL